MQDKPLTERQRYWLEHIQSWNKSGKRITEYASDQDFPVRAMYDAKKRWSRKVFSRAHARPVALVSSKYKSSSLQLYF